MSRQWVVTPVCISLLFHFMLLTAIHRLDWLRVEEFERRAERIFTIETGTVSPETLERIAMVPEWPSEHIYQTRTAPELAAELFPEYRDPGPRHPLPEKKAVPRYEEEELPLVAKTGLSQRSRAFVRDGELDVVDPGKERIVYIPSGRSVGPAPSAVMDAAPTLRDDFAGLVRTIPGKKTHLLDAGTAPRLSVRAPLADSVAPGLGLTGLGRDAERLFAEKPGPASIKPLALDVKIDVYAEPRSKFRFFRMTIRQSKGSKLPVIAKNVLFVIDISASIRLRMLDKIRAAVRHASTGLNRGDRFNVVRFSERSYKVFKNFVPATRANIAQAARSIHKEPGQVRTDVYTALKDVIAGLPTAGQDALRPTNILLISDGNPTTGIQDIRHIVNDLTKVTRTNYSIFAVNPGAAAANSYLLDLLAYRNRGVFVRAKSPDDADAKVLGLLIEHKNPVLMNLRSQYANFQADQVYPTMLPNLYAGRPIIIYGRCLPGDAIAVEIIGDSAKERRKFLYTSTLPEVLTGEAAIAREWARGKIHYLTSLIARLGERKEYLDEIRRLSKRYSLASPYR